MSVYVETSLGHLVIDVFVQETPIAAKNFLKLCKMRYYNGCLFYNVQPGFMVQTGDPSATGRGGTSVYGLLYGEQARFFEDEFRPALKHNVKGSVSMANMGAKDTNSSQFFITLRGDDNEHLDGKHTVFGRVEEGLEVLDSIGTQFIDDDGRPYCDIRVLHTHVLDDPFPDPPELEPLVPPQSPAHERPEAERVPQRLAVGEDPTGLGGSGMSAAEIDRLVREREARSHAVVLEMLGDLPDADAAPPENVLFVCKLNPVTTDDDLEIVFSRFGPCRADIVRDHVTGDSLNFAFVEFESVESCEEAYRKMDNVLIDDRRIKVDFSQSVAKQWSAFARGRASGQQGKRGGAAGSRPPAAALNGARKGAGGGPGVAGARQAPSGSAAAVNGAGPKSSSGAQGHSAANARNLNSSASAGSREHRRRDGSGAGREEEGGESGSRGYDEDTRGRAGRSASLDRRRGGDSGRHREAGRGLSIEEDERRQQRQRDDHRHERRRQDERDGSSGRSDGRRRRSRDRERRDSGRDASVERERRRSRSRSGERRRRERRDSRSPRRRRD